MPYNAFPEQRVWKYPFFTWNWSGHPAGLAIRARMAPGFPAL